MLAAGRFLLPPGADATPEGPLFAVPSRALALVGAFAFCVLLTEGAINDWSAIYIEGDLDASESTAAAGLAAFSLTMGFGRLFGDRLNLALGPVRLARGGAALAAAGIGIALLAQDPPVALFGFALRRHRARGPVPARPARGRGQGRDGGAVGRRRVGRRLPRLPCGAAHDRRHLRARGPAHRSARARGALPGRRGLGGAVRVPDAVRR